MDNNTNPLIDLSLMYGIHSNEYSDYNNTNSSSYRTKSYPRQQNTNISETNDGNLTNRNNLGAQTIPPESSNNTNSNQNTSMSMQDTQMMSMPNQPQLNQLNDNMQGLFNNGFSVTPENVNYLTDFMRTQSGKPVTIDFVVGNNSMITEPGILIGVGCDYILIYNEKNNNVVACDSSDIKFVRFPQ